MRPCPECLGARLRPESRAVKVGELPIHEFTAMSAKRAIAWLEGLELSSQDRLIEVPGMLLFSKSRRLCYIANFTDTCPEMAPPGWNLYVGTSVPKPAVGDFDEAAEIELLKEDLREHVQGFDSARVLSITVTRDGWPPQRAVAGHDLPHTTPIANLWNVGDGVKEYANGGTTACAETAKLVRAALKRSFPGCRFSVRSSTYAGGAAIHVSWVDGPRSSDVDARSATASAKGRSAAEKWRSALVLMSTSDPTMPPCARSGSAMKDVGSSSPSARRCSTLWASSSR